MAQMRPNITGGLGADDRSHKASGKEDPGKSICSLETVVVEIEAMLNDRPLSYVSPDLSDPEPLTPSHFYMAGEYI